MILKTQLKNIYEAARTKDSKLRLRLVISTLCCQLVVKRMRLFLIPIYVKLTPELQDLAKHGNEPLIKATVNKNQDFS